MNVQRRTRRKPSTIRGAAPEVVIGQSTAARAGAHPYRAGEVARSYHSDSVYQRFNSHRNKGLRDGNSSASQDEAALESPGIAILEIGVIN